LHPQIPANFVAFGAGTLTSCHAEAVLDRPVPPTPEVAAQIVEAAAHRRRIEVIGARGAGKSYLLRLVGEVWGSTAILLRGAWLFGTVWLPLLPVRRSVPGLDLNGDAFAIADRLALRVGDGLLVIDDLDALDRLSAAVIHALPPEVRIVAARQRPPFAQRAAAETGLRIELAPLDQAASDALKRRYGGTGAAAGGARGNPLAQVVGVTRGETVTQAATRTMTRLGPGAAATLVAISLGDEPRDSNGTEFDVDDLVTCGALVVGRGALELANRVWLAAAIEVLSDGDLDRVVAQALAPSNPLVRAATWSALGKPGRAASEAAIALAETTDDVGSANLLLAAARGPGWEAHAAAAVATLSNLGRHDEVLAAFSLFPSVTDRVASTEPPGVGHPRPDAATCAYLGLAAYALQEPALARAAIEAGRAGPIGEDPAAVADLGALELKSMIWFEGRAAEALDAADSAQRRCAASGVRSDLLATAHADALAVLGGDEAEAAYRAVLRDSVEPTSLGARSALSGLSTFLLLNGRLGAGRKLLVKAIREAEAHGAVGYVMQFTRFLLIAQLLEQGPTEDTVVEIDRALARPTTPSHRSLLLALSCLAATWRGDGPAAARTFLSRPALRGDSTATATWGWAAAEWHWHQGRLPDVEAAAHHALSDGGAWFPASTIAEVLARWARLETGLPVSTEPVRSPFALVAAATPESLGIEALARNDPGVAYDFFIAAAAAWAPACQTGTVRALDGAALAARRAGRIQDARRARRRANTLAARLELLPDRPLWRLDDRSTTQPQPSIATSDRLMEARRRPDGDEQDQIVLTASEQTVMELVASGLTSKQVARHRGVKASTVDSQITSARAKLGGGSRKRAASIATADRRRPVEVWLIADEQPDPAATARRLYTGIPIVDLVDMAAGMRIQPGSVHTGTLRTLVDADRVRWSLDGDIDSVIRISTADHPGLADFSSELAARAWVRHITGTPTVVEQIPAHHRRLLALLAAGRSIYDAGQALGTSERSTHRNLAFIRTALGVSTTVAAVTQFRSSALLPDGLSGQNRRAAIGPRM